MSLRRRRRRIERRKDRLIRHFVETAEWKFASTMADNPHWYVLERDYPGPAFLALVDRIKSSGEMGRYKGYSYRYLTLIEHVYWVMPSKGYRAGLIINRKPSDKAGWDD